jgi:hypothetical protein
MKDYLNNNYVSAEDVKVALPVIDESIRRLQLVLNVSTSASTPSSKNDTTLTGANEAKTVRRWLSTNTTNICRKLHTQYY